MAKIQRCNYVMYLLVLILLIMNIFFFMKELESKSKCREQEKKKLSWSQRAAEEAEAVASISCSGHGKAYLDSLVVDGIPTCECYTCYTGPDCSLLIPNCSANAFGWDPLFYEPFWMENAESSAVVIAGWHRMAYSFPDPTSHLSQELEKTIRKLHSNAKNAITDGRYIAIGVGASRLLNAVVHSLSMENYSSSPYPAKFFAKPPHYPFYKLQTDYLQTRHYEFIGDPSLLNNSDIGGDVFEFVTSPSNPEGNLEGPVLKGGPNVKYIFDRVYYWPQFTAIPAPADDDLMIFSLSKLTGHAGTRLGWAVVKDVNVYNRMKEYIHQADMEISKDTLLRALTILRVVNEGDGKKFFNFAHEILRDRWEKISHIFSFSKRFSIQHIPTQYCTFLDRAREPSPAFAWVKCKREEDKNCTHVFFEEAKIRGHPGSGFFADNTYVRLGLVTRQHDFDMLISRLEQFISQDDDNGYCISPSINNQ
ncbi:tryptophan aminotransferase-related protein 3 [Nicotiana tabacum]|uniref:Tryptophan aminotransferase-related protein 3 n=2 Tax=Nicotiana tabacum TaxID=4097 RepID=A0A1S4DAC5_TOBAC|nr:PREDICTED: tryptophan aminotransferase-related protein 3-like [Nicotiana tabacum]XP_016510341.1 PREDICTED: tryptophan aminotransferase-related protein 3-like [Nicotiana tabacum]